LIHTWQAELEDVRVCRLGPLHDTSIGQGGTTSLPRRLPLRHLRNFDYDQVGEQRRTAEAERSPRPNLDAPLSPGTW
jgi:hypothetical protein